MITFEEAVDAIKLQYKSGSCDSAFDFGMGVIYVLAIGKIISPDEVRILRETNKSAYLDAIRHKNKGL